MCRATTQVHFKPPPLCPIQAQPSSQLQPLQHPHNTEESQGYSDSKRHTNSGKTDRTFPSTAHTSTYRQPQHLNHSREAEHVSGDPEPWRHHRHHQEWATDSTRPRPRVSQKTQSSFL